jgi:F-type H+-transporting ATPase subunit gamma
MTRRQDLERHLDTLNDLVSILTAMKNLALVEMRKLAHLRANHEHVVSTITRAAQDFLAHHPALAPPRAAGPPVLLAIGSERGFCGNFNDLVMEAAAAFRAGHPLATVVPVGSRLISHMQADPGSAVRLEGASAAEEVPAVLMRTLDALQNMRPPEAGAGLNLWAVHHDMDQGAVRLEEITAIRPNTGQPAEFATPPVVNMDPARFLVELIEQHLFALLTRIFYSSLMSENRFRLAHMENATRRIETRAEDMTRRRNILRQEEVTQEIELIVLSAEALEDEPKG